MSEGRGNRFPFASAKEVFAETQGSAAAATAADVAGLRSRACAIADTLAGLLGESLQLTFTDNTSTMVSFRRREGLLRMRVHRIFLDAPMEVLQALAGYAAGKRGASARIEAFVKENLACIQRARKERHRLGLRAKGLFHDLGELFDQLNRQHFDSKIEATIGWGRGGPRRRRQSIRMGVYLHDSKVIRIHPALDRPEVPSFFVRYVVFHEMLHQAFPPRVVNGRRLTHTPEFRAAERAYPDYERAIAWERENIHLLLQAPAKPWTFDLDDPLA